MRDIKLLIITNIPVGYRNGLFNELIKLLGQDKVRFLFIPEENNLRKSIAINKNDELFLKEAEILQGENKFKRLKAIIKEFEPTSLIIGGLPKYLIHILPTLILKKINLISWWGGTMASEGNRSVLIRLYRKFISRFLWGNIFYSNFAADQFKSHIKNVSNYYVMGNNTRDAKRFAEQFKMPAKKTNDKIELSTIGFQESRKNTIIILKALTTKKLPNNVHLNVVGDGPELPMLKEFAKTHQLNVKFWGFLKPAESYKILSQTDIFIHAASMDQWPQAYNEAVCLGIPSIVSNTSGIDDYYVNNNKEIVLFEPYDENGIADRINHILDKSIQQSLIADLEVSAQNDGIYKANQIIKFINE